MKHPMFKRFGLMATICCLSIVPARSSNYFFYDVADTSNIPPFFSGFSDFPALNNTGTVAFRASEDFSVFQVFAAPVTGGGPYVNVGEPDFTLIVSFDPFINDSGTVAFYGWVQAFSGATNHAVLTA